MNAQARKPAARTRDTKTIAKKTTQTQTPVKKPVLASKARGTKPAAVRGAATGDVLKELKSLAKELSKTAKGLSKKTAGENPKAVANILGNVERMTADAATRSLQEAEAAKLLLVAARESLGKDWSRKELDSALKSASEHLTNIMVAQEFQDLAGQAIRQAMKALVGAIIVVEGGGATEEGRLSQSEVDKLLDVLGSK